MDFDRLKQISREIRYEVVKMSHRAETAHLGGALSVVDILVAAYWSCLRIDPSKPSDPDRDRLILSKGHAVSALYAVLAKRGFFPCAELDHYNEERGHLPEQPSPGCLPGVEWATGSLGHGLPVGLGMALAAKINGKAFRVVVVMSDGECQEGSVWEAAMLAPKHLDGGLIAIVDYNKWQATGRSNEIMGLESLRAKWTAFGWNSVEVDGHCLESLMKALTEASQSLKPFAIVANTIKGRGVSFMEDDNNWHYRSPSVDEVAAAARELEIV